MPICREPIVCSLTRRCAEPGNLSAANSGTATLSIGTESAIQNGDAMAVGYIPRSTLVDSSRPRTADLRGAGRHTGGGGDVHIRKFCFWRQVPLLTMSRGSWHGRPGWLRELPAVTS